MKIKQLKRLQKADTLIRQNATGNPKEFAKKLHISERLLYILLYQLKNYDAPILYDRKTCTYYYTANFELKISISVEIIKGDELIKIYAGQILTKKTHLLQGYCSDRVYVCNS